MQNPNVNQTLTQKIQCLNLWSWTPRVCSWILDPHKYSETSTHTQSDIYTDISIRLALYTERAVHKGNTQEGTSLQ